MKTIEKHKERYSKEIENISEQIRDHYERYGYKDCGWLRNTTERMFYYKGAYNALVSLEKEGLQ